jgi:hypothetical protein
MSDREDAERQIQAILIDLEESTGQKIEMVRVDTRNFEALRTEIFFTENRS